jgi:hypothetical protein
MVERMGDVAKHEGDRPASPKPVAGDQVASPPVGRVGEPDAVLWLQQRAGNAVTTRLLAARTEQPRRTSSPQPAGHILG